MLLGERLEGATGRRGGGRHLGGESRPPGPVCLAFRLASQPQNWDKCVFIIYKSLGVLCFAIAAEETRVAF